MNRWLSFFLLLVLVITPTVPLAADDDDDEIDPEMRIDIEEIDASRYPLVDVYFRVHDTVPSAPFYDITSRPVNITGKNDDYSVDLDTTAIGDPKIVPLALTLNVDRSGSVSQVLPYIREATQKIIRPLPQNGPHENGDKVSLLFFSGVNVPSWGTESPVANAGFKYLAPTKDEDLAFEFSEKYLATSSGNTPLYNSWNLALTVIGEESRADYPAKGMILLSDGKPWPESEASVTEKNINFGTYLGISNNTPVFSVGFPLLTTSTGGLGDVNPDEIGELAENTGGSYFHPKTPWPKMPPLPDPPDPDTEENRADPEMMDDDIIMDYHKEVLEVTQKVLESDDLEGNFDDYYEHINNILLDDVSSESAFLGMTFNTSSFDDEIITTTSYDILAEAHSYVSTKIISSVPEELLERFYMEQMSTMFTKIRSSMKRIYRVSFKLDDDVPYDGSTHTTALTVSYQTQCPDLTTVTLSGDGGGEYVAPRVVPEDNPMDGNGASIETLLDPDSPMFDVIFTDKDHMHVKGVRITEFGDIDFQYDIEIYTRTKENENVLLASKLAEDEEFDFNPDIAASEEKMKILSNYIDALELNCDVDTGENKAIVTVTSKIPGCLPGEGTPEEMKAPRRNPQAGEHTEKDWSDEDEGEDFRSFIFYRIRPYAVRPYTFKRWLPEFLSTIEGEEAADDFRFVKDGPHQSVMRQKFPPVTVFCSDNTPPSLALYCSIRRGERSCLQILENTLDEYSTEKSRKLDFYGNLWDDTFASPGPGGSPFSTALEPNEAISVPTATNDEVKGLFVRQGARFEFVIQAKDNYDRNLSSQYITDMIDNPDTEPSPELAFHNQFRTDYPEPMPEEEGSHIPYLPHIAHEDLVSGEKSGYSIMVREGGQELELRDFYIFRHDNYPNGDHPVELIIKARDAAGNLTHVTMPVFVVPQDYKVKALELQGRRVK